MAVLVEATSLIIRAEAISEKLTGGWERFTALVPTGRFCSDDELVSVSLVEPADVTAFANQLGRDGLNFEWEGAPVDIAFADQKRGLITPCDWVEFSRVNIGIGGTGPTVAICRFANSVCKELRMPPEWQFSGSLTELFGSDG